MAELNGPEGLEQPGTENVPTWRAGARLLTREEKAALTPAQLERYLDDSVLRDLSEIDLMPEPLRSWTRGVVERAQAGSPSRSAVRPREACRRHSQDF